MSEWQPIETAPKDGGDIILTDGNSSHVGRWCDSDLPEYPWRFLDSTYKLEDELNGWRAGKYGPTHWQPLPKPPTGEPKE